MNESPCLLDCEARRLALEAILAVCKHRAWFPYAVHVRSTHVHAVIDGAVKPERMLTDFKAYATRTFRSFVAARGRRRYWADHGSTRYLWNQNSLKAAIDYVLEGQGEPMARYPEGPER